MSAPIKRRRDGRFAVKLDPSIRTLLVTLSEQVTPVIAPDEPMTKRLFPPAYPGDTDEQAEAEYRHLVDTALANHHRQALAVMVKTAHADTLSEAELSSWLSAVGSLRLIIGTRLDVSEDMERPGPEDETASEYALYELLSQLQYLMIEVLAADLPDEGRPAGAL